MEADGASREGAEPSPSAALSPSRPLSTTERDVWLGFLCTHLQLLRTLDRKLLDSQRIAMSSYEVLLCLAESPEGRVRMKDIASSLLISRSGLTRIVDDLERQGYVAREKCPTDARGMDAVLTAAGRTAYRRARKVHLTNLRKEFLDKLSAEQLQSLSEIWKTLGVDEPGAEV
ncbi:MarR family transcriptional regulator [Streptomyces sp. NPDC006923]|uniref:MarR family winged helix-turn-helix transcriptional regulator n=1 Tax=Streptomyces sp. NPDC006923 TaxID=3155355 RepID=UPI0033F2C2E9